MRDAARIRERRRRHRRGFHGLIAISVLVVAGLLVVSWVNPIHLCLDQSRERFHQLHLADGAIVYGYADASAPALMALQSDAAFRYRLQVSTLSFTWRLFDTSHKHLEDFRETVRAYGRTLDLSAFERHVVAMWNQATTQQAIVASHFVDLLADRWGYAHMQLEPVQETVFACNLLVALTVLVGAWLLVAVGCRAFRISRARAGGCTSCGYNLTGNVSGVCPECGEEMRPSESVESQVRSSE